MPITALSVQTTSRDGVVPAYAAGNADGGHAVDNAKSDVVLHVKNGGASPITVTIGSTKTVDGRTLPAKTVSVANASERLIGPFPAGLYNESDLAAISSALRVTFSGVTSVTIGAFKVGSKSY
jgi:hypothetical protein